MRHLDDDYEIDAIEKCSRALMRLDDKTKIRVVRYLLDKFGLIAQADSQPQEVVNNIIHNQQNNLVLTEPKAVGTLTNGNSSFTSGSFIALKDVLIKNLAKSEPELMVIIGYYNSNFGKGTFTKQSILDSYRDNGISSESRRKNVGHNINSLIKKSLFSTITDEELAITPEGTEYAQNILSGNSTTKKRKQRPRKPKSSKNGNDESNTEDEPNDLEIDEQA